MVRTGAGAVPAGKADQSGGRQIRRPLRFCIRHSLFFLASRRQNQVGNRHSLGPLIRDGLVRLRVEARDRRVKRVVLTPAGVAKFEETAQLWRKAQRRFEQAFGAARAAKLRSELRLLTSEEFKDAF